MSISIKQLRKDMDPCFKGPISLDALARLHRWGGASYKSDELKRPNALSLSDLGHRHSKVFRFLWLNAYLMPTIEYNIAGLYSGEKEGAPMIPQRASEIAWICQDRYDCIALCEVWTDQFRDQILKSMNPPYPLWAIGPGGGTRRKYIDLGVVEVDVLTIELLCSGLLTMNPGYYPRIGNESEKFNDEGSETRDADAYANKGILKVTVETGFNTKLEIYSTHLLKGGDFQDLSAQDRISIQAGQIDQLVNFIGKTHEPSNFIIVAGDFNVDAAGGYYEELRTRLEDKLGLEDVWTYYAQKRYGARAGNTDSSSACQADPACSEFADDNVGAETINDNGRIDYIFVQKPSDSHDINVDIARPRRKHFPRDPSSPGYDQISNLSDHAGIELKLFLSIK